MDDYEDDFDFDDHYGLDDSPKAKKEEVKQKGGAASALFGGANAGTSKQSFGRQPSKKSEGDSDLDFGGLSQNQLPSVRASKDTAKGGLMKPDVASEIDQSIRDSSFKPSPLINANGVKSATRDK